MMLIDIEGKPQAREVMNFLRQAYNVYAKESRLTVYDHRFKFRRRKDPQRFRALCTLTGPHLSLHRKTQQDLIEECYPYPVNGEKLLDEKPLQLIHYSLARQEDVFIKTLIRHYEGDPSTVTEEGTAYSTIFVGNVTEPNPSFLYCQSSRRRFVIPSKEDDIQVNALYQ